MASARHSDHHLCPLHATSQLLMPSTLDTLVGRVTEPQLREELRDAIADLRRITDFGLVFESHLPETVRLPHHVIRRGIKVARSDVIDQSMFEVLALTKTTATIRPFRHPDGSALSREEAAQAPVQKVPLKQLVAIAEFGDPIYPGLRRLGGIHQEGDRPAHVIIKGENPKCPKTRSPLHQDSAVP